ncbi:cell separation during budding [Tulasnella sp. JGI-2019a]|nr:cell separation during budding [Tulasnella sp. JGI-2019a]KAG9002306.1 cell separation during budding [Tulasnella sp. JGI-2019a]
MAQSRLTPSRSGDRLSSPHHIYTGLPPPSPRVNSSALPVRSPPLPTGPSFAPVFDTTETEEWMKEVPFNVGDIISGSGKTLVDIGADETVEKACQLMLEKDVHCLAVYEALAEDQGKRRYTGLFDHADLNAFLLLAVESHAVSPDIENGRVKEIIAKGKEGGDASVGLACDLSQKNPLVTLPPNASLTSLLSIFSRGTHRILIVDETTGQAHGLIEDRQLVRWFTDHASEQPFILSTLATPLSELTFLPYIAYPHPVISASSDDSILDAMRLMSNEGVNSIAVTDPGSGNLHAAVTVTDIGKIVAPSQDKRIIFMPISQLVARIKAPLGSTDGAERYPVYSVVAGSTLDYVTQKLLATNSHRVFIITDDPFSAVPVGLSGNLRGVVSMVDVLSVFARLANIPDVDPTSMAKHRRASSVTSNSSGGSRSSRSWNHSVTGSITTRRGAVETGPSSSLFGGLISSSKRASISGAYAGEALGPLAPISRSNSFKAPNGKQ